MRCRDPAANPTATLSSVMSSEATPEPDPSESPRAVPEETLRAILGVTAAGKTELSLGLAESLGIEVLSMDSMLVYRGLDVGTAKPTNEERARVAHHLIDLVDPSERYDVQRYLADFDAAAAWRACSTPPASAAALWTSN